MVDPDIFEGPTVLVDKGVVDLVEHFQTFDDVAEHGVLAIEVFYPVFERKEELTPTSRRLDRSYGHAQCTLLRVFERVEDFGREVTGRSWGACPSLFMVIRSERFAARTQRRWIARLCDKVLAD